MSALFPMMEGVPMTAVSTLGIFLSTLASSSSTMMRAQLGFVPAASSMGTLVCLAAVAMQTRVLERRSGSARHFMFSFWSVACAIIVSRVTNATLPTSAGGGGVARNDLLLVTVCCALTVRLLTTVPAHGTGRHTLSDKWIAVAATAKLVLVDAIMIQQRNAPSLAARLVFAGTGIALGLLLRPKWFGNTWALRALDNSAAFERVEVAVRNFFCGGAAVLKMAQPARLVDADAADPDLQAAIAASQQQHVAATSTGRPPAAAAPRRGAAPAPSSVALPANDADVETLMALGLQCSRGEAAHALAICNGNVDAAAALLMDG